MFGVATHNIRQWTLVVAVLWANAAVFGAPAASDQANAATDSTTVLSSDELRSPIFSIETLAVSPAGPALAGREVSVHRLEVTMVDRNGFWVSAGQGKGEILVVPAEGSLITVHPGDSVDVHGEVRFVRIAPHRAPAAASTPAQLMPSVYAYTVRPAW